MAKLSLIIPVYNEARCIADCLEAALKQQHPFGEIIIADNGSTDQTIEIASRYKVKIIKVGQRGTVFARNAAFETAKGDILARIDADTILPADWTQKMVSFFDANPGVAGLTGRPRFRQVLAAWLINHLQVLFYQKLQKLLTGSYILWGANMAIRREAWLQVAALTNQRTDIDEDIDLSFCFREKGLAISYQPGLWASVSLQRERWDLVYTLKYLATWPRDYVQHSMYLRALLITLVVVVIEIITLPITIYFSFKPRRD